jgi:hypothetical protein
MRHPGNVCRGLYAGFLKSKSLGYIQFLPAVHNLCFMVELTSILLSSKSMCKLTSQSAPEARIRVGSCARYGRWGGGRERENLLANFLSSISK